MDAFITIALPAEVPQDGETNKQGSGGYCVVAAEDTALLLETCYPMTQLTSSNQHIPTGLSPTKPHIDCSGP
ncbi:hypothetical protein DFP72DRAFT_1066587 [Ephemerocybe angulata]|uniref:Uncharacterized protein n=1 Tax=Ephemerocybe angulata TaxID=980116 RepID=A0A8H6I2H5_9AGAR|nr:hypothetical protein DFP72DRAFT_1066587 [Tulosesus angulatus]